MQNVLEGITTIFFDLDGTLNNLTTEDFLTVYAKGAYKHFSDVFDTFETFVDILYKGTLKMMASDNGEPVVNTFFNFFADKAKCEREECITRFVKFYETNFDELAKISEPQPYAKDVVDLAKAKGIKLVLATQPIFYELATRKRVEWLGIDIDDFVFFTHATNSKVCKPNLKYFTWLLDIVNSRPEETLMVGNDLEQDMVASKIGIKTWFVGEQENGEIKPDFSGSLLDLYHALEKID